MANAGLSLTRLAMLKIVLSGFCDGGLATDSCLLFESQQLDPRSHKFSGLLTITPVHKWDIKPGKQVPWQTGRVGAGRFDSGRVVAGRVVAGRVVVAGLEVVVR